MWKFEPRTNYDYDIKPEDRKPVDDFQGTYIHSGTVGMLKVSNAHKVELAYHAGSAFGAAQWPVVRTIVPFPPDSEAKAQKFAERVRQLITEEFGL